MFSGGDIFAFKNQLFSNDELADVTQRLMMSKLKVDNILISTAQTSAISDHEMALFARR